MLFAGGLTYATYSLLGEFLYAAGQRTSSPAESIGYLRGAASGFPLNPVFRKASALRLTEIALSQGPEWKAAALAELYAALEMDPTSADLLFDARRFELELGREPMHREMFERLARVSAVMRQARDH